jgi:hypothetical protein
MRRNRFFHLLRFLHFSDSRNEPDKTEENYEKIWKTGTVFDKLSTKETQTV